MNCDTYYRSGLCWLELPQMVSIPKRASNELRLSTRLYRCQSHRVSIPKRASNELRSITFPSDSYLDRFQSLKGHQMNCDNSVFSLKGMFFQVSIPKRASNELRCAALCPWAALALFQSLKGHQMNCDQSRNPVGICQASFQSLKGHQMNCDKYQCLVKMESLSFNP